MKRTILLIAIFIAITTIIHAEIVDTDLLIQDGDNYVNLDVAGPPEPEHGPVVTMTGGTVGSMGTWEHSSVNMSGGNIDIIACHGYSSFTITGGHVQELEAGTTGLEHYYPTVNIHGGSIDVVTTLPHSTLSMSNGEVGIMEVGSDIPTNITGGRIWELRSGDVFSKVNIANATVNFVPDEAQPLMPFGEIIISNSIVNELYGFFDVNIEITGGEINLHHPNNFLLMRGNSSLEVLLPDHGDEHTFLHEIYAIENSLVELHAGEIDRIIADHDSLIKIYGEELEYFPGGMVRGYWADGTPLEIIFEFPDPASGFSDHVILVPEPTTLLLLGLGGLLIRKK